MDQMLQTLWPFLSEVPALTLATTDEQGLPHAASVYFVSDERLNLYFISAADTAHSRHIVERSAIAATIHAPAKMWQQIRGLQIHGTCEPVHNDEWEKVWKMYVDKFPFAAELQQVVRTQSFYRIAPTWLRWIDNSVRFGFKVETPWPNDKPLKTVESPSFPA